MKFSFVRTDSKKDTHLTVKPVEWFMERIQSDTKAGHIGKLREYVAYHGKASGYVKADSLTYVYPSVELTKTENGLLEIVSFNSLITLHVSDLLRAEDMEAVKEVGAMAEWVVVVDDDPNKIGGLFQNIPVKGPISDIKKIIEFSNAEEVIIAINEINEQRLHEILALLDTYPVRVRRLPIISEMQGPNDVRIINVDLNDLLYRDPIKLDNESFALPRQK